MCEVLDKIEKRGEEKGIKAMVNTLQELSLSKEAIIKKLVNGFGISLDVAEKKDESLLAAVTEEKPLVLTGQGLLLSVGNVYWREIVPVNIELLYQTWMAAAIYFFF